MTVFNVESDFQSIYVMCVISMMMNWRGNRYSIVMDVGYVEWEGRRTSGIAINVMLVLVTQ